MGAASSARAGCVQFKGTPLHCASAAGYKKAVRALLELGASAIASDVASPRRDSLPSMRVSPGAGVPAPLSVLIDGFSSSGNLSYVQEGTTPREAAARAGHADIAALLDTYEVLMASRD